MTYSWTDPKLGKLTIDCTDPIGAEMWRLAQRIGELEAAVEDATATNRRLTASNEVLTYAVNQRTIEAHRYHSQKIELKAENARLREEIESELQGQVQISTAAGGMHDKLSTEITALRNLLSRCFLVLRWADGEASPSAARRNLIEDIRQFFGRT